MNFNILSYCIYGAISILLTIFVGKMFHKNGYFYIDTIFQKNSLSQAVNNLLLIGFYLINIGYSIYKISQWETITNTTLLIENLSINLAAIFIILAILNYINIGTLAFIKHYLIHNKK